MSYPYIVFYRWDRGQWASLHCSTQWKADSELTRLASLSATCYVYHARQSA